MPKKSSGIGSGRPPKQPSKKVGFPVRAQVTPPVLKLLMEACELHGVPGTNPRTKAPTVSSDLIRLYLAWGLQKDGLWTKEIAQDPSWDKLRQKGLL